MSNAERDVCSYTIGELLGMSGRELAALAMRAEEESSALWREHTDASGEVPRDVETRSRHLSAVSDALADLARRNAGS